MRSIKVAIILGLALVAGCTVSASVVRGDETQSVIERDDMRRVHNATCRIKAYNNGILQWMGSGLAYEVTDSNKLMIVSNNHVVSGAEKLTVEFWHNGDSLGEYVANV